VLTVPGAQSATEDTTKAITGISVADVDAATGAVKITVSVASGTFSLAQTTGLTFTTGDGTGDASMVFTGTVANVNAALATVNYLGNANYNGSDTLNISVDDQAIRVQAVRRRIASPSRLPLRRSMMRQS